MPCVNSFYMVEINFVIEICLKNCSSLQLDGRNKRNRRIEGVLLSEGGDVHAYVVFYLCDVFKSLFLIHRC